MTAKKRSPGRTVGLIIIAAIAIAGLIYFINAYFQVRHVEVAGNAYYTAPYIAALANVSEGTHMMRVNDEQIISNIENAEPYLRVDSISRQLPDTLVITVQERRPEALLPYGTDYLLIDMDAVVLEMLSDRNMSNRPEVLGINVNGVQIGEPVVTDDTFKISVLQELLTELDSRGIFDLVATIDLSNINNIRMISTNGLQIRFGQASQVADKIKWIANRLPALEREGQSQGVLDVSAGSFATYTMYDGTETMPEASPTMTNNPAAASASPEAGAESSPSSADMPGEE